MKTARKADAPLESEEVPGTQISESASSGPRWKTRLARKAKRKVADRPETADPEAAEDAETQESAEDEAIASKAREVEADASKARQDDAASDSGAGEDEEAGTPEAGAVEEKDGDEDEDGAAKSDAEDTEPEDTEPEDTEPEDGGDSGRLGTLRRRLRIPDGRRPRIVLAAVLAVVVGGGAGGYFWSTSGDLPEGVAFRAEGQNVTAAQLKEKSNRLQALYGLEQPTEKGKLDTFWRSIAQADAVRVVLSKAAERKKVVVADKAAQDVMTRFVAQQYGTGPDAESQFLQALGNAGTSKKDVLQEVKYMLATNQLYSKLTAGTSVTDKEVREAFTERRTALATPERRDIRNIVVSSESSAKKLVSRLEDGEGFEALAKKHSLDDATRSSGGDLGEVQKSTLDPTYGKAAFAAGDKEVFGPVKTEYGWNVGKVDKVVAAVPATYEGVKTQLKQTLIAEKAMKAWRKWITQQIRDADVQYAAKYRPADPDALPDAAGLQKSGLGGAAPSAPAAP
ncbi:PpiC-type peptidyl-prolyl cis-trans isomerase [Streptomyces albus]|uniref:PpiC-type peptidyl-prolyl cis-trans isomerase n=1 Tax=Streptomyces albus (strain ATCC 21838 / DSM 41398 / FERM P-419 / JCM 4703 / NBRC 107858) TaxID=1081613 RepID=A0A0B5F9V6_STRA4|nr:PpiC-type peptidyl-prolyl cis-trans isomerase [Streptomyces albus]AOU81565.1 PpiC-type peptidyl-prolyl cis-trans isomerase [Streptomyces albus]AYN37258.1 peptidyl-prolyl cis-trans isomerase C [Streptomyces albus]